MFEVVNDHVFPFLRTLGGDDSTYAHHMKDARFTIPTPALLAKVVDMIDGVPMEDRDTKGDLYEYMLGKIASARQNGQFRTPRSPPTTPRRTTSPTSSPAGRSATGPSVRTRAPRKASACPGPTSPRRATISRSTDTRKSSTPKSRTARRAKF